MNKLLVLLLAGLTLVGCSNKTSAIICTDTYGETIALNSNSDGGLATITSETVEEGVSKEDYEEDLKYLQSFLDIMNETDGLSVSASHKDETFSMNFEFDFSKIDEQAFDSFGYDFTLEDTKDINKVKTSFEDLGFTCE